MGARGQTTALILLAEEEDRKRLNMSLRNKANIIYVLRDRKYLPAERRGSDSLMK